jgi:hypothetical protein
MASATVGILGAGWLADTFGPVISLTSTGLVLILAAAVTLSWTGRITRSPA